MGNIRKREVSLLLFRAENITKRYGGLVANSDISIEINKGDIVGLIGPNGAGKSTFFKMVSGVIKPTSGRLYFNDVDITNKKVHEFCDIGIACTFQHAKVFSALTVFESVLIGSYNRHPQRHEAVEYAREIIDYIGLTEKSDKKISSLNMFDRKKVELAMALATQPELLLLDELFAGCTPVEADDLVDLLRKINKEKGTTIFIIEHVIKVIMRLSDKVIVFDNGKLIANGTPAEVQQSKQVLTAYLGEDYDASQYN